MTVTGDYLGREGNSNIKDERRIIIIDFNHLAHKYWYGKSPRLSTRVMVNGLPQTLDTTIPNYTIKQIVKWSQHGMHPTVVCFDSPIKSRKYMMKKAFEEEGLVDVEYKGDRVIKDDKNAFFSGLTLTSKLLLEAQVGVLKVPNYEADDLIFAAVQKAKEQFPNHPIDVITNDWDLAPLCDDQVSVYMRSTKRTLNTTGPKREKYVQVTPETYAALISETTSYKNYYIPYNTMLLWKLLRGDSSDNIPGLLRANKKGLKYPPKKLREILQEMEEDGHNLGDYFRYGAEERKFLHIPSNKFVTLDMIKEHPELPKTDFKMIFDKPRELVDMLELLQGYFDDEDLAFIEKRYQLMNLNNSFVDVPQEFKRAPIRINGELKGFDISKVVEVLEPLQINIPPLK